jgi:hypothetical protein
MEITEARKLKAIRHIVNDYSNLVWLATAMVNTKKYADIERSYFSFSFLLFYRALAGFLSNRRFRDRHRKGDIDISAKDFVGGKNRFTLSAWGKWDDHMNAHLFHLGYLRTRNSRPWNGEALEPMFEELTTQWKRFCDELREPYRTEFRSAVDKRRQELKVRLYP